MYATLNFSSSALCWHLNFARHRLFCNVKGCRYPLHPLCGWNFCEVNCCQRLLWAKRSDTWQWTSDLREVHYFMRYYESSKLTRVHICLWRIYYEVTKNITFRSSTNLNIQPDIWWCTIYGTLGGRKGIVSLAGLSALHRLQISWK